MDPAPETMLTEGDSVTLVVSKGPEFVMVPMPDLMGCSESEALTRLEANGLTWDEPTYEESDGTPGLVIWQSVEAGTEIEQGSAIQFKLSKEPEKPADITITYPVILVSDEGDISVLVYLDGALVYTGTHQAEEGSVNISLTAAPGDHDVQVYQNDELDVQDTVTFG